MRDVIGNPLIDAGDEGRGIVDEPFVRLRLHTRGHQDRQLAERIADYGIEAEIVTHGCASDMTCGLYIIGSNGPNTGDLQAASKSTAACRWAASQVEGGKVGGP